MSKARRRRYRRRHGRCTRGRKRAAETRRLLRRCPTHGSMCRDCRSPFLLFNRETGRRRRGLTAPQRSPHQAVQCPEVPSCHERGQQPTSAHRAREQQRRQPAQARPEPPIPVDHTFASADDHVRGTRGCRPCPALCRAPPPAQGRQLPTATTAACRCERASTARWSDAAAARSKPRPAPNALFRPTRPNTLRLAHALQQLVDRLTEPHLWHQPRAVRAQLSRARVDLRHRRKSNPAALATAPGTNCSAAEALFLFFRILCEISGVGDFQKRLADFSAHLARDADTIRRACPNFSDFLKS